MSNHLYLFVLLSIGCASASNSSQGNHAPSTASKPALALAFKDFLNPNSPTPEPSATLRSANGKHVRLAGFMVQMEELPVDGFYLAKHPVFCDEMGAGTGDLPPDAVRVHLQPTPPTLAFLPGPISVEGRLELGRKEESQGQVTHIRLYVDVPQVQNSSNP